MSKEKMVALALAFVIFVLIAGSAGISMKGKKAQETDGQMKVDAIENAEGLNYPVLDYNFEFDQTKISANLVETFQRCLPQYTEKEDFALELLIQWFDDEYPESKRDLFQTSEGVQIIKHYAVGDEYVIYDNAEGVPSALEFHSKKKVLRCRQLEEFECYCE